MVKTYWGLEEKRQEELAEGKGAKIHIGYPSIVKVK